MDPRAPWCRCRSANGTSACRKYIRIPPRTPYKSGNCLPWSPCMTYDSLRMSRLHVVRQQVVITSLAIYSPLSLRMIIGGYQDRRIGAGDSLRRVPFDGEPNTDRVPHRNTTHLPLSPRIEAGKDQFFQSTRHMTLG